MSSPTTSRPTPSSTQVLTRALKYGALLALAIVIVMGIIGWLVSGWPGVTSALIGTGMAVVFLGITAASILLANRFINSEIYVGAFFGIVLGSWLLKFIVFIVLSVVLKGQPWIDPMILFISVVAGVVGSLTVDVVVVARSKMPHVSDLVLPKANSDEVPQTREDAADPQTLNPEAPTEGNPEL